MKGWPTRALADVCQIRPPKAEARRGISDADLVSFVPMEDLGIGQKNLVSTQVKPLSEVVGSYTYFADGDVLLAKITPCFENGKLGIAAGLSNSIGFGSSEYVVFRPSQSIDKNWLYYFLSRESFRKEGAERMSGAVGHKRVAKEFIEAYPIPLPPLPEQKRIIAILDEAFEGISVAAANAEKNLANARELFESYLNSVFIRRGEGWVEATVEELVGRKILSKPLDGNHGEIHPKKAEFVSSGVPFIMASDLMQGVVDQENCNFLSPKQASSLRTGFSKDGDVLLSHKGTIGRAAILHTSQDYVMLTPQVTYYRVVDRSTMFNRFLYYMFQTKEFQEQLYHYANEGSTRAYIGITKQLKLRLRYPSLHEQKQLVAALDTLVAQSRSLEAIYGQKVDDLAELKQAILQKAFAGELTTQPEKALREVAAA
jgi:type I restriction enzyme, S subunit